jgi:hypothetical protein
MSDSDQQEELPAMPWWRGLVMGASPAAFLGFAMGVKYGVVGFPDWSPYGVAALLLLWYVVEYRRLSGGETA